MVKGSGSKDNSLRSCINKILREHMYGSNVYPSTSDRIVRVQKYWSADHAAKTIWDYFVCISKRIEYGISRDYRDDIYGDPIMEGPSDSLYLIKGEFDALVNNSVYKVSFEPLNDDGLKVTVSVENDPRKIGFIDNLLESAQLDYVQIEKEYSKSKDLGKLYQKLRSMGGRVFLVGETPSDLPGIKVGSDNTIIPTEGKVQITINNADYFFHFYLDQDTANVLVKCPRNEIDFVTSLLDEADSLKGGSTKRTSKRKEQGNVSYLFKQKN